MLINPPRKSPTTFFQSPNRWCRDCDVFAASVGPTTPVCWCCGGPVEARSPTLTLRSDDGAALSVAVTDTATEWTGKAVAPTCQ